MITSPAITAGVAHTIIVSAKPYIYMTGRVKKKNWRDFSRLIIDLGTNGINNFRDHSWYFLVIWTGGTVSYKLIRR